MEESKMKKRKTAPLSSKSKKKKESKPFLPTQIVEKLIRYKHCASCGKSFQWAKEDYPAELDGKPYWCEMCIFERRRK